MKKALLCIAIAISFVNRLSAQTCTAITYNLDFSASVDTSVVIQSTRNGDCCGGTNCIRFDLIINPACSYVNFTVQNPAPPGNAAYYQVNCGPQTSLGTPICVVGQTQVSITFCKPGNDNPIYTITAAGAFQGSGDITVREGCTGSISVTGLTPATINWTSIYPGAQGAYDSYLSCSSGCTSTNVTPLQGAPAYIDYKVSGFRLCGPIVNDTIRVYTTPQIAVTVSPNTTTICAGTSTTLTATASGGDTPYNYLWSTGQTGPSITVNTGGVYTVSVTDIHNCLPAVQSGTVTIAPVPNAPSLTSNSPVCEGSALNLFASTVPGATYSWTGPNGFTSSLQNPTGILYTTAGTYTVALYAANASDTDTVISTNYITVNVCGNPPNANFVASSNNICVNDPVDFTDLSTNSPDTWNWTFFGGTPNTSTAQNPTGIIYTAPGIYDVKLVVSNANGSDSLLFTNYISVTNCIPPVANFIASDTSLCVGDSINFFDLSSNNPTSHQWTFFGATPPVSSIQNPTGIVYNTPGVYTVQLIVGNSTGFDTLVMTNYINVSACVPPVAFFAASQTTICEGFCVDFSDQSTGTPTSWIWLFPGSSNSPTSTAQNPTNVCYQDSGAYNVTLIVQNAYGYDTIVQLAYIHVDTCPKPIVNFMASDTYFCSDNCIDFTDLSANIDPTSIAYWKFPGGVPSDTTIEYLAGVPIPVSVCYPNEGIYDAILIEVNQYGSDTLLLSQYISVINVPGAYVSNDTAIQFGASAQLNAGGGISYHWTSQIPGSTFIPSDSVSSPIVIPNSNPPEQTYTYYCEITDATTGCKTVKQVTIEILHEDNIFVPNTFKPSGSVSAAENATVGVYATNVESLTFTIYDRWGEKVFESHSACPDKGRCDVSGWDGTYKGKDCEPGTYIYTLFLISEGGGIYNKNGNITLVR